MRLRELEAQKKKKDKIKKSTYVKPTITMDLGKNAFVAFNFKIPVVKRFLKGLVRVIRKGKDGDITEPADSVFEYTQFVKLYLIDDIKEDIYKLDLRAKELLLYILYNIEIGQDFIGINREEYMKIHKIKSENTFLQATKDLAFRGFITMNVKMKDVFWLNPQYFFRGDRVKKYSQNVIIKYDYTIQDEPEELNTEE